MRRILYLLLVLSAVGAWAASNDVLFEEDFEGVTLGPNVDEGVAGKKVWTNVPPAGWTVKNDLPAGGVTEWAGWAFADGAWWTNTAADQRRSEFTNEAVGGKARGVIAVADPDEFDDKGNPLGENPLYNSWLSTPPIPIHLAGPESIILTFDSSWRPEDNQKAALTVSFDGGPEIEVMTMVSVGNKTDYQEPLAKVKEERFDGEQINETMELAIPNPAGSREMVITWALIDGGNDWWWAIDHVKVVTTALAVDPQGKTAVRWGDLKARH